MLWLLVSTLLLGSIPSESGNEIRIFFLGDSISAGVGGGIGKGASFTGLIPGMLKDHYFNVETTNLGKPGETTEQALERLQRDVIGKQPSIVVVMYGTNDAFVDEGTKTARVSLTDYKRNLANIVRQLQDNHITPIVMTPPMLGNFSGHNLDLYAAKGRNFFIKPYISACREVAENHRVRLADHFLRWEEKQKLGAGPDQLLADGIHPNAEGHRIMALELFPALLSACHTLPSSQTVIEKGSFRNIHYQAAIKRNNAWISVSGVFGYLYADFMPGAGDFELSAGFMIPDFNGAAPAFVFGDSELTFYNEGKNLMITGMFSGYRTLSVSLDSLGIDPEEWMELKVARIRNEISISFNGIPVHTCYYLGDFGGKTGFEPGQAIVRIREFRMAGNLLPVSVIPKSFTIPVVDLTGESARQVVVDREKDQYLGHPTTALLDDSTTLFAVYPKGHGRGALVLKKSDDGGLHWSDRLEIPENWSTSKEVPTVFMVGEDHKTKRLALFTGLYPIRISVSSDMGSSWSPLEPLFAYGGIVAMSDMVRKENGDYMAFFHDDGKYHNREGKKTNRFFVYKTISTDGGLTWSDPGVVTHHKSAHLCEGGLVESPDGSEWALLLRENSRNYNSMVIFSRDEGESWTPPVELPASLTGDRHQLQYAPDGRLVAVFRDMAHFSPTRGDFVAWVGNYDDIVNGNEGAYRIRLLDNKYEYDCGYAGLELLPGGILVATTYGHWDEGEAPYIISVRFCLDETDDYLEKLIREKK